MNALDALLAYGPLVYAAVMVPLLIWLIVGVLVDLRRGGHDRVAQHRAAVVQLRPRTGEVAPAPRSYPAASLPFNQE